MFFADSAGLFSLVSLWIQSLLAWMFMAFFAVIGERDGVWIRHWRRAFLALGIGLTALSVRFALAHHFAAGERTLDDREWLVRLMYGVYLGGKVAFAWFLVAGAVALRQRGGGARGWLATAAILAGAIAGALLPTVESILLVQAPWFTFACVHTARMLRAEAGSEPDPGRRLVRAVVYAWGVAWVGYGVAVIAVGPLRQVTIVGFSHLLRFNSTIDLAVQVALACGLIMIVMGEARRTAIQALGERDLLREQLRRDEKARAMSTLIGGIAHEINNPLTAMLGFADDLGAIDPERREQAARIVLEQAERCRAIVRRMSMLGRHAVLETRELPTAAAVQRVLATQQAAADARGVRFAVVIEAATLSADPTSFDLVLGNLLSNAVQASPHGGEVRVVVEPGADAERLVVEDQGAGLPPALRERAFEPFWTTRQGQGVGLGLAVVAALVNAHGGSVQVEDAAGGGARFVVRWPRRAAGQPAEPPRAGLRLLVVDDEPLVRRTVARQASRDGWSVVEAGSVDDALRLLFESRQSFDAVICDLRMPGRSGVHLHDVLAQRAPELLRRCLFITGDLASAEAVEFARRCSAPIVGKPFVPAELCARLRTIARCA